MLYIRCAALYTPTRRLAPAALLLQGEKLLALGTPDSLPCPPDTPQVEAPELTVAPGFIDLQLNGAYGLDFTQEPSTLWTVAQRLPEYGVTAFLPTIITSPAAVVDRAQAVLQAGAPTAFTGARPLGLHLEGPFLNPQKRGAHNPRHLRVPDAAACATWSLDCGIRLVTLAPELPGALALIRQLRESGVVVSAGHSLATLNEAETGFNTGITYGTHLFNAMSALDHRAPGLAGALLTDKRLTVGLIPDGIHVHPAMVALAWQMIGPDRLNVVTDAMAALGMPTGVYRLGDFDVTVDASSARLADGRLAGSVLSLPDAIRNLIAYTGCSLSDALTTVTQTPARCLGLTDRGQLVPGSQADLVFLTPALEVAATMIQGQIVYHTRHWPA